MFDWIIVVAVIIGVVSIFMLGYTYGSWSDKMGYDYFIKQLKVHQLLKEDKKDE